jgi:hypothetical protein
VYSKLDECYEKETAHTDEQSGSKFC